LAYSILKGLVVAAAPEKKKYMASKMKYNCMLSGEKRAEPCAACPDSSKCMTDSLQVKEPEMNPQEKRPVVKITADGEVSACAKGAEPGECGYKPGAKVCGKCGALAVQMKMDAEMGYDEDEDDDDEEMPAAAKKRRRMAEAMEEEDDDDMVDGKGAYNQGMSHVDDPMDPDFRKRRKARHKKRMASMGVKSDDMLDDVFLCSQTREIKSAATDSPCAGCRGGCKSDNASPDLLEIEALAEDVMNIKVHFSGYGDEFGMFVVQGHRKADDQAIETYWTDDGELDGWFRIPEEELMGKSAVIALDEAVGRALETIRQHTKSDAEATGYGVGEFEGKETIVIEVKSGDTTFDVHVTSEGDVPGFEQVEIKSEDDDDLEVKRMFSDEQRASMAEGGEALPDGSYPIANEEDLKNAIQAFGRAKDPAAAKAHIMKRARALGKMDLIPQEWMGGKKDAVGDVELLLEELSVLEAQASLQGLLGEE
jgi:hypothetical protein